MELLKSTARRSIFALVVLVPMLIVCWQVARGRPIGELTLGIYVSIAALLILCEYALAFDPRWGSAIKGRLTDFLYVGVASSLEKLSFVLAALLAAGLGRVLSQQLEISLWPASWHFGFQLLLALLIADVGTYWRHRLFHISPLLWRFHSIHHSMPGLIWIRSAYTHPIEQLCIMIAIMFPIAFMGAGDEVIVATAFLYGLSGLIQHANIDARSSLLNYFFATSEVHRIHHTANERGNSSNFSAFFVLMDHLFGTFSRPDPAETRIEVGLEGVDAFPDDFLTHMVMPFKPEPVGPNGAGAWGRRPADLPGLEEPILDRNLEMQRNHAE